MNLNDARVYSLCNTYLENNENFFGSTGNYRDTCQTGKSCLNDIDIPDYDCKMHNTLNL